jgi:hypothetical protein
MPCEREYELEYIPAVRQAVEILICDKEIRPAGDVRA